MSEIRSTTDYDQFKQITSNREVDVKHVKRLVRAITKENLLHLNCILVNEALEIIDGQHRLEAARELGVPIYYQVDSKVTKGSISALNSVKKGWTVMDYINYYCIEKANGFDQFNRFLSEHPDIPASTAMMLLSCDGSRNTTALREGVIDISNYEQGVQIANTVKKYRNYIDWAYNRNFILAIAKLVQSGLYNHEVMEGKLEFQSRSLVKCVSVRQYIEMLEEIYNYKTQEKNKVSFASIK